MVAKILRCVVLSISRYSIKACEIYLQSSKGFQLSEPFMLLAVAIYVNYSYEFYGKDRKQP